MWDSFLPMGSFTLYVLYVSVSIDDFGDMVMNKYNFEIFCPLLGFNLF